MLSQDAQMLLSFCFCFVFTDVIKHYTSLEGNLGSISCPLQYRAAQTCQPQSRTANQTWTPRKAPVIFPLDFESAFLRAFLIHIKSVSNDPLALIRAWYCNDTESCSSWAHGIYDLHRTRFADFSEPWEMPTAIPQDHRPQFWPTKEHLQSPPSMLKPQMWPDLLAHSNCTKSMTSLQILANIHFSHTHTVFQGKMHV